MQKKNKIYIPIFLIAFIFVIMLCYTPSKKEGQTSFVGVVSNKTSTSISVYKISDFDTTLNVNSLETYEISALKQINIPLFLNMLSLKENDVINITHPTNYLQKGHSLPAYEIKKIDVETTLNFNKYDDLQSIHISYDVLPSNIQNAYIKNEQAKRLVETTLWKTLSTNDDNYHFVSTQCFLHEVIEDSSWNRYGYYLYYAEYAKNDPSLYKIREIKIPVIMERNIDGGSVKFIYPNDTTLTISEYVQQNFPKHIVVKALDEDIYETIKKEVTLFSEKEHIPSIIYDENHTPIYVID